MAGWYEEMGWEVGNSGMSNEMGPGKRSRSLKSKMYLYASSAGALRRFVCLFPGVRGNSSIAEADKSQWHGPHGLEPKSATPAPPLRDSAARGRAADLREDFCGPPPAPHWCWGKDRRPGRTGAGWLGATTRAGATGRRVGRMRPEAQGGRRWGKERKYPEREHPSRAGQGALPSAAPCAWAPRGHLRHVRGALRGGDGRSCGQAQRPRCQPGDQQKSPCLRFPTEKVALLDYR